MIKIRCSLIIFNNNKYIFPGKGNILMVSGGKNQCSAVALKSQYRLENRLEAELIN